MPSKNPILNSNAISSAPLAYSAPMTVQGAIHRTLILLSLVVVAAAFTWSRYVNGNGDANVLMMGGAILGFVTCLITCFKKEWAPTTTPIYAVCEGLFLGGVSAYFDRAYPGVAMQASMLTFGTLFALLGAYRMGWIRATERFKAVVVAATLGVSLVYLVSMVLNLFGCQIPMLHGSGDMAVLFSLVVIAIAAMNLVLDFAFIEEGAAAGIPKYMEWYAAFGLMVSLIWLYMEILRLLVNLSRRR